MLPLAVLCMGGADAADAAQVEAFGPTVDGMYDALKSIKIGAIEKGKKNKKKEMALLSGILNNILIPTENNAIKKEKGSKHHQNFQGKTTVWKVLESLNEGKLDKNKDSKEIRGASKAVILMLGVMRDNNKGGFGDNTMGSYLVFFNNGQKSIKNIEKYTSDDFLSEELTEGVKNSTNAVIGAFDEMDALFSPEANHQTGYSPYAVLGAGGVAFFLGIIMGVLASDDEPQIKRSDDDDIEEEDEPY